MTYIQMSDGGRLKITPKFLKDTEKMSRQELLEYIQKLYNQKENN